MATNTYVALTPSITLSSDTTTVTLSSIPAGYTDLRLVIVPASSSGTNGIRMRINGDTTAIYSGTYLDGNGTSAASWRDSAATQAQLSYRLGINTTLTQVYTLDFMDYSNTTTNKSVICRYNDAASAAGVSSLLWRSTTAINSLSFNINGFGASTGNFITGSTFSLYGIAAEGVTPAVKATGGVVSSDSTYYYHTFLSSGTFTPLSTISCDVLVVAGGAGGGSEYYVGDGPGGGGGGAGGFRLLTSQSMTATGKTVTIGGGGAGATISFSPSFAGSSGVNSSISGAALTTITGSGGGGGGSYNTVPNGVAGGSGGGGTYSSGTGGAGNTGSYSPVEGYAGGIGNNLLSGAGGGGGGAGGVGAAAASNTGGAGGVGAGGTGYTNYAIIDAMGAATGTGQLVSSNYYYAGGGGGSGKTTAGAGGYGGGATNLRTSVAVNATANTGGGGAGSYYLSAGVVGGAGGSGVVIVRYLKV